MTVVVVAMAALAWGLGQWPKAFRWYCRLCAGAVLTIGLVFFWRSGTRYMERFTDHSEWGYGQIDGKTGIRGLFFCTEHVAASANGDLGGRHVRANAIVIVAEFELGFADPSHQSIEFGDTAIDKLEQVVVHGNAIAPYLNVHRLHSFRGRPSHGRIDRFRQYAHPNSTVKD